VWNDVVFFRVHADCDNSDLIFEVFLEFGGEALRHVHWSMRHSAPCSPKLDEKHLSRFMFQLYDLFGLSCRKKFFVVNIFNTKLVKSYDRLEFPELFRHVKNFLGVFYRFRFIIF
jgi:hypothetical protein